ncbi:MAG TPA: DoxX family protein [Anaeromyxobacteraceae bacterium]|nr:DoxX family protein [Anaeromyxobacteraceae bacterium]
METGVGKGTLWTGRVVSALPVLMMAMSGGFKLVGAFTGSEEMLKNWAHFGYPPSALLPIGILEVACALVYAFPRTSVLGAVLVTGYLGGAVATHVRMSESVWFAPALLGALAWLGLFLRDPRLRALLPLRRDP